MEQINNFQSGAKHYIITYHCEETYDWQLLLNNVFNTGRYTTVSGQLERGKKNDKIHVQAYIQLKKATRGNTVLKDFPEGTWFKQPNKFNRDKANTGARMHEYSIKSDTRISSAFLVLGEPPQRVDNAAAGKQGRELQIKRYSDALTLAKNGQFSELQSEHPDLYIKHYTTFKKLHVEEKVVESYPFPHPFRPWQIRVNDLILKPDDRSVTWLYDKDGNAGKSTYFKWLSTQPTSFYLDGGKKQDNIFLLKEHHTLLLIDLPRNAKEYVPYATMETFKNGIWTSTKYEGNRVHRRQPGAVIVAANFLPDVTKLSMDRWDIYIINVDQTLSDIYASDLLPNIDIINV